MSKTKKMNNGEHARIYEKIDDTRKELAGKISEVNENITNIKVSIASIDTTLSKLPCTSHDDKIEELQSKTDQASGAIKTFYFLLVIITLIGGAIGIARFFGLW